MAASTKRGKYLLRTGGTAPTASPSAAAACLLIININSEDPLRGPPAVGSPLRRLRVSPSDTVQAGGGRPRRLLAAMARATQRGVTGGTCRPEKTAGASEKPSPRPPRDPPARRRYIPSVRHPANLSGHRFSPVPVRSVPVRPPPRRQIPPPKAPEHDIHLKQICRTTARRRHVSTSASVAMHACRTLM